MSKKFEKVTPADVLKAYEKHGKDMVNIKWKDFREAEKNKIYYIHTEWTLEDGKTVAPFIQFKNEITGGIKSPEVRQYGPTMNYRISSSDLAKAVECVYNATRAKVEEAYGTEWVHEEDEMDNPPDIQSPGKKMLTPVIYEVKVPDPNDKKKKKKVTIKLDEPFVRVEPRGKKGEGNSVSYEKIVVRDVTRPRSSRHGSRGRSDFPIMEVEDPNVPGLKYTQPTVDNFHLFIPPKSITSGTLVMGEIKMLDKGVSIKPYIINTIYCAPGSGDDSGFDEDDLDDIGQVSSEVKSELETEANNLNEDEEEEDEDEEDEIEDDDEDEFA